MVLCPTELRLSCPCELMAATDLVGGGMGESEERTEGWELPRSCPSPPRTYYLGTGALEEPLRTYYFGYLGGIGSRLYTPTSARSVCLGTHPMQPLCNQTFLPKALAKSLSLPFAKARVSRPEDGSCNLRVPHSRIWPESRNGIMYVRTYVGM